MFERLVKLFCPKVCEHIFDERDLKFTNIPEPEKPAKNASYAEWEKYHSGFYESDFVNKRVVWPCSKCKKEFHAHCGLDILNHGKILKRV